MLFPDLRCITPLRFVLHRVREKTLLYLRHGKDGEVYSVGPDRDDDKLRPKLDRRHVATDNGDLAIESF